jgi:outer membrane protein TolC
MMRGALLMIVALSWSMGSRATEVDPAVGAVCPDAETPQPLQLVEAVRQSLFAQPRLIIARQDLVESRSDVTAAVAPFLPSASLSLIDERYVPANGGGPVIVVGNNVLGGAESRSGYGSLSMSWNIMNSGRDIAGLRSARAAARAASFGLDSQLADTLSGTLQAYADLYEAQVDAANRGTSTEVLKQIYARAQERYRNGNGTTVAVGQARAAELDAEQSFNKACRAVSEKAAVLAESAGMRLTAQQRLQVTQPLPMPLVDAAEPGALAEIVENTPAVIEAKQRIAAATAKFQQARRSFGPSVTFSARKDYLGQSPYSFGAANHHIGPSDYRIDLGFEQPLFPLVTELAAVDKARAEVRRAQASYDQARLEAQTKLRGALSAQREAEASFLAAKTSLGESQHVLELTQSLYQAGRIDLDSLQRAQMDRDKAMADTRTLASRRASAQWAVARALQPEQFADFLFAQLHLQVEAQRWREGDDRSAAQGIPRSAGGATRDDTGLRP